MITSKNKDWYEENEMECPQNYHIPNIHIRLKHFFSDKRREDEKMFP